MQSFAEIHAAAVQARGDAEAMEAELPRPKSPDRLAAVTNQECLAEMTRRVFRAGFVSHVIDSKWSGFDAAFHQFDPVRCAALSDADLEALCANRAIVRNRSKILAVRANARFVLAVAGEHGSFAALLAAWAHEDTLGLWRWLREHGSRLGGLTGPLFLSAVGRDTFVMTPDVVKALGSQALVSRMPVPAAELVAVQHAFNQWHAESGRPLCQIARLLALSAA